MTERNKMRKLYCSYNYKDIVEVSDRLCPSWKYNYKFEKRILATILWFLMFAPMLIVLGLNYLREKLEE